MVMWGHSPPYTTLADYSGVPRVTARVKPGWNFIWVKQTNKIITRNCLTRENLWGNATGSFPATDLTRDVVITSGKSCITVLIILFKLLFVYRLMYFASVIGIYF